MRHHGWLIMALMAAGALSGCETMSPEECRYANWNDVGLRDGLAGKPVGLLDERVKSCAKAGMPVDTRQYLGGRELGLRTYCQLDHAVPLGLNGDAYLGVCPPPIDVEFRRRYQMAYAVHDLRARVEQLDRRAERQQHELREIDLDEDKQLKAAGKDEDRQRIHHDADERRRHLRGEMHDLDRNLRDARDNLRAAERMLDTIG